MNWCFCHISPATSWPPSYSRPLSFLLSMEQNPGPSPLWPLRAAAGLCLNCNKATLRGTARQGEFAWRKSNPFFQMDWIPAPTHPLGQHPLYSEALWFLSYYFHFFFFSLASPPSSPANWPTFLHKAGMFSLYSFLMPSPPHHPPFFQDFFWVSRWNTEIL